MPPLLDNEIVAYDAEAFPFAAWVAERVADAGYDGSDLHRLHERVPLGEVAPLQKRLIGQTARSEFRDMAHGFVRAVIAPLLGEGLAMQRFFNIRIMLPDRQDMIIAFHNGTWYGHGLGETTIWVPLVRVWGANSLQVIDREPSRRITAAAVAGRWSHEQMQQACREQARPVELTVGQALLFQQENLHGNLINDTGVTRLSIDFRVAVAGGNLHRKLIGGYFDLLDAPPSDPPAPAEGICIGYVNNNTRLASGVPIHLQRLMMTEYCERHALRPTYEQLEIEVMPHLPTLQKILGADRPAHVLLYSIYALPDAPADRAAIYDLALSAGVTLHFADEDRRLSTPAERDLIERMLTFAELGSPV